MEPVRRPRHYSLELAYDGGSFHGWQRQPGQETVQGALERVLSRLSGQPVTVRGCGRTDAGVHALRYWATASMFGRLEGPELLRALQALLPDTIRVHAVDEDPRARDALRETWRKTYFYQYHIGSFMPPHRRSTFALAGTALDLPAVRRAARALVGIHDFRAFTTDARRQRSTVRNVHSIRVMPLARGVRLFFTGSGFLYNMVRTMAATLREVGRGRMTPEQIAAILQSRDRAQAPATAPACGLFLLRADRVPLTGGPPGGGLRSSPGRTMLPVAHPGTVEPDTRQRTF